MKKKKPNAEVTVTLSDIAKASGFSISIVSRVLRNRQDRIPEATREKVREAATQLGYRRNLLIRGVQTGRSMNIGVIVPPLGSFTAQLTQGIHDALVERDYCMFLASIPHHSKQSAKEIRRRIVHSLLDRRVDGIILRPTTATAADVYYSEVVMRGIPLVAVDRPLPGVECSFSGTDDELGGRLAARELISAGHRNLAFFTIDSPFTPATLRQEGFEAECAEASGAKCRIVQIGNYTADLAQRATEKVLAAKNRPTAIAMHSDDLLLPILPAAQKLNLRIPEDLSIVGFGNQRQDEIANPPITSIEQHPYEIGQAAARMILQRIDNSDLPIETQLTEPTLIQRKSVA